MKSAAVVNGHLARLLLLACTVLGVAALHTIGHAGLAGPGHPPAAAASAVVVAAPDDFDGCDGDGCLHHAAGPGSIDTSRWWDVCLAILSVLAAGAFAAGLRLRVRGVAAAHPAPARWRPPPRGARGPTAGLAMATVAVLRT